MSFLNVVATVHSKFGTVGKIIICWDSPPYKKSAAIEEYKGTRKKYTEEDLELVRKAYSICQSDQDRLMVEKKETEIELYLEFHKLFNSTKDYIINTLSKCGILSLQEEGFEADDIAYFCGRAIKELGKFGLLVSADSDWRGYVNENVDLFRIMPRRSKTGEIPMIHYTYNDAVTSDFGLHAKDFPSLSIYQLNVINEIYNRGHNDVKLRFNKKKHTFANFCKYIVKFSRNELPKLLDYFNSLDVSKYYWDLRKKLLIFLTDFGTIDVAEFGRILMVNGMYDGCIDVFNVVSKLDATLYDNNK